MKKLSLLITIIVAITLSGNAYAKGQGSRFSLPEKAKKISDNVYYLGKAYDKESGRYVEGIAIERRKDGEAKPPWAGGGGGKNDSNTSSCYEFLARGAKWRNLEPWLVNADSSQLDPNYVFSNMTADITKWEDAASFNILGDGTLVDYSLVADTESTDGKNEVYFDLMEEGTIGVTIIWGIFSGPPRGRELVEWDQVYNTFYLWSEDASGSFTHMDFESIATHELGHSVGLGDLYSSECAEQTMYGYGTEGEIKKRTLEDGDITGISELYN